MRVESHKTLVRIANREHSADPDQTAFEEAV